MLHLEVLFLTVTNNDLFSLFYYLPSRAGTGNGKAPLYRYVDSDRRHIPIGRRGSAESQLMCA